ncbi:DNA sulfur modification protein DndD [Paenibacillus sp. sgz500958]|uniref:DNA sulfur modification protein DndD n=1 Tax=Paenibacillus sp. sgz500958 TaxID=3242475 RepID=UPI0036D4335B
MKFIRLRITNIGAFHGSYDFDLRTERGQRNVVLFGGKNGSGKTTILESVKLALFGALAYGYKSESLPYYDKVQAKLNNIAKKNRENRYQIILDVEIVEDFKKNLYTIRRSWSLNKNNLKEDFTVLRNRVELSQIDRELFHNKLRENTPPQLMDLCLFDGEKISHIISDEILSDYLRETAKVMFNLDLFENLESDLHTYLKQENIQNSLSEDQQELIELNSHHDTLQIQKENMANELEELEKQLEEKTAFVNELLRNYEIHGGLMKEQRETLLRKNNEIEQNRKNLMDATREDISSLLPFALVKGQLANIQKQMQDEIKHELINNIDTLFQADGFQYILNQMQQKGNIAITSPQTAQQLREEIVKFLSQKLPKPVHRASFEQKAEIQSICNQIKEFNPTSLVDNFKKNTDLIKQSQNLRKKLTENDNTSELHELLRNITDTQSGIASLEHNKIQKQTILADLEEELLELRRLLSVAKEKQMKNKKSENIFAVSTRLAEVSRHFRRIQLTKKLQEVEIEAAKMLRLLFRKELFVVRLWIHPETFQLRLYNSLNEEILKGNLSAGETQILLLSTIWAMAKSSNRRLPFIFDTLLGRLDQTHKKSIIENFIPRCGDQVIILSTDSEVDEEHYKLINRAVSKEYVLDFNTEDSNVHVHNHYFQFQR